MTTWSGREAVGAAFAAWSEGRRGPAFDVMVETFRQFEALTAERTGLRGDTATMLYLMQLVRTGAPEAAFDAFRRVTDIDPAIRRWYFTFGHTVERLRQVPDASPDGPPSPDLMLGLPLWGRSYEALWAQCGLRSLLSTEAEALFAGRRVELRIFTDRRTAASLAARPETAALRERIDVRMETIERPLQIGGRHRSFLAMAVAHWTTLLRAAAHGAGAVLLFADQILSAGSLAALAAAIGRGDADILFALDLNIDAAAWPVLTDDYRAHGEAPALSGDDLAALFREYPSEREIARLVDPAGGGMPGLPYRFTERTDGAWILRSAMPQPLHLSAGLLRRLSPRYLSATDDGLADAALAALGGTGRMRMLDDPSTFLSASVELHRIDALSTRRLDGRPDLRQAVVDRMRLARVDTPARLWSLGRPLVLGAGADGGRPVSLLDTIAAETRPSADAWFDQFVQDVAVPAFDAVRPGGDASNFEAIR